MQDSTHNCGIHKLPFFRKVYPQHSGTVFLVFSFDIDGLVILVSKTKESNGLGQRAEIVAGIIECGG